MNSLYHSFQIGFNYWFLTAPAVLLLAVIIDSAEQLSFSWGGHDDSLVAHVLFCDSRHYASSPLFWLKLIVWAVGSVLFAVMFWRESWHGLLQSFDNCLTPNESGFWSLLVALFAYIAIIVAYGLLLLVTLDYGRLVTVTIVLLLDLVLILIDAIWDLVCYLCSVVYDICYHAIRVGQILYRAVLPPRRSRRPRRSHRQSQYY